MCPLTDGLRKTTIYSHVPQSSVSVVRELIGVNWVCAMLSLYRLLARIAGFSDSYGMDSSIRTSSIDLCFILVRVRVFH